MPTFHSFDLYNKSEDEEDFLPHPLDLPTISSKPSYPSLRILLEKLTPAPPSWTSEPPAKVTRHDYTPWLTRLIASNLHWLTPSQSEQILSLASTNLALRAGRSALPDITRTFTVHTHNITLFEPGWTGDSIGHKTWGTSLLLARRVSLLSQFSTSRYLLAEAGVRVRGLGLGEGTGLVGIAAAKTMGWDMTLTDLPEITVNLRRNVEYNCGGEGVEVKDLDWMDPPDEDEMPGASFDVIIASDLFYDVHHPALVVAMMERYLKRDSDARVIIEYPLRPSHISEVQDFEMRMSRSFVLENAGEEIGRDDWDTDVHCKWAIYKFGL